MFCVRFDDLPIEIRRDWQNRFQIFNNYGTVLPSWNVRFFDSVTNEKSFEKYTVGSVGKFHYYRTSEGYWIFSTDEEHSVAIRLSSDFINIDVYYNNEETDLMFTQIQELLCQAYKYRCLSENGLLLHSSCVSYFDNGIMFIGNSGAGKSTQAEMWKKFKDARILNYDQNYVYNEGGRFIVSSSPWGGKEKYYVNETVALKALILVQRSLGENRVEYLGKGKGFSTVYLHNYLYPINQKIEGAFIKLLNNLIASVPVYELYCTKSRDAVDVLGEALFHK